ncbi:bifunctional methionine sulfoxide reductase B/A protein [Sulfurimonas sp.]|uniref:bifunctional methionine sulfoxide reductase B/A protein n=1 Tax=Sulfurimonas sp. TaxID=2022749 RepID=UPI002602C39E|nr:bifunctional methionine sulfoxide reductase B/A protein [Sulfurimonas sp.]MCW8896298.1 bifunctional methionine sulfoxide reductase B/A protein [Sulfurimonas sp.]MCW9068395.1 bifunctional methionine sulfoxide reductase B/A protein [Sulfurimonas sp.]
MKYILLIMLTILTMNAMDLKPWAGKIEQLSDEEKYVIINKGTERPFTGKYTDEKSSGIYTCKLCGTPLYDSSDKFNSSCGWPSFDDTIPGAVKRVPDADGRRVEIVCATCGGHLGHVFEGEGFTPKNTRHCVNSISLKLEKKPDIVDDKLSRAYFAGGCFWGVEYYLRQLDGVKDVWSGFMGGHVKNPSYYEVVRTDTGHLETVEVIYDPSKVSFKQLARTFFEIHDPTQTNGQGPDIGPQYLSAVFTNNENETNTVRELISQLEANGYKVATQILPKREFYKADEDHQKYYTKKGSKPYCHGYTKRF